MRGWKNRKKSWQRLKTLFECLKLRTAGTLHQHCYQTCYGEAQISHRSQGIHIHIWAFKIIFSVANFALF
jgi:hypothetical protein